VTVRGQDNVGRALDTGNKPRCTRRTETVSRCRTSHAGEMVILTFQLSTSAERKNVYRTQNKHQNREKCGTEPGDAAGVQSNSSVVMLDEHLAHTDDP
jgi:hypothetical protein